MEQEERDDKGRWKPGFCPNPNGRPPSGKAFSDLLRQEAEEIDADTGLTNAQIIAKALVSLAKQGNVYAIERYADRLDGKPKQSMDITGNVTFPQVIGMYPEDYDRTTAEDTDINPESE